MHMCHSSKQCYCNWIIFPQHTSHTFPGGITSTFVPTFVLLGLHCIGGSCYVACSFPFIGNQLIGASGEQFSFAMHWLMWGFVIAYKTTQMGYLHFGYACMIAPAAAALLCVSAIVLWHCKYALDTTHQLTISYKLIFKSFALFLETQISWKTQCPYLLGRAHSISHWPGNEQVWWPFHGWGSWICQNYLQVASCHSCAGESDAGLYWYIC